MGLREWFNPKPREPKNELDAELDMLKKQFKRLAWRQKHPRLTRLYYSFFPPPLPKPPTEAEMKARHEKMVRRIVSQVSMGDYD